MYDLVAARVFPSIHPQQRESKIYVARHNGSEVISPPSGSRRFPFRRSKFPKKNAIKVERIVGTGRGNFQRPSPSYGGDFFMLGRRRASWRTPPAKNKKKDL